MEELKNLRNYQEFKDAVNEELLFDAIKALFSKVFSKISKPLTDAIANFTKYLDKSKTWEESVKFYDEAVRVEQQAMAESLKTATGPLGLRKILADNTSITFVQLQELSNKYGSADLAAKKIFAGQPEAAMFNFDKSDQFNNNLMASTNAKMMELNKADEPAYDETALKTYLDKNNQDINKVEEAPKQGTTPQANPPANPPAKPPTNPPAETPKQGTTPQANPPTQTSVKSSYTSIFTDKLNEAGTTTGTTDLNAPPNGNIESMKVTASKWMADQLYGFTSKKIKEMKAPAKVGQEDAFDTVAKGSKATTLTNNLAKLLRNIVNIPADKKDQLIKVRDVVATAVGKTPEDFRKEMPL